jgi:hypothetical protein
MRIGQSLTGSRYGALNGRRAAEWCVGRDMQDVQASIGQCAPIELA